MEAYLYENARFPFTAEWYLTRGHAPHLEQPVHRPRMLAVAALADWACASYGYGSITDLGAGDGGTLSLTQRLALPQWGYDLMEPNVRYAREVRGMDVRQTDFVDEPIDWGELVIVTEVLEHLEHPHSMVRRIHDNAEAVVASSPSNETEDSHDECHAWVWDMEGYARMFQGAGFDVVEHLHVGGSYDFQVLLGVGR